MDLHIMFQRLHWQTRTPNSTTSMHVRHRATHLRVFWPLSCFCKIKWWHQKAPDFVLSAKTIKITEAYPCKFVCVMTAISVWLSNFTPGHITRKHGTCIKHGREFGLCLFKHFYLIRLLPVMVCRFCAQSVNVGNLLPANVIFTNNLNEDLLADPT